MGEPGPDPSAWLDLVADATGERLTLIGRTEHGEVGALFVRRADGSSAVLSRGQDARGLRRAAEALDLARARGILTPRYAAVVERDGMVLMLQERLPGTPPDRVDTHLVDQLLALVDALWEWTLPVGVGPGPTDLYLHAGGPGFCRHESLVAFDDATREVLGWVRSVDREYGTVLPGENLVHLDLHPLNVLVDAAGRLTGVVDWDTAGRGDARIGWVTLVFDLRLRSTTDRDGARLGPSIERLDGLISTMEPGLLAQCWAHMSLRQIDWSIRHHTPAVVDAQLRIANDGRRRHGLR